MVIKPFLTITDFGEKGILLEGGSAQVIWKIVVPGYAFQVNRALKSQWTKTFFGKIDSQNYTVLKNPKKYFMDNFTFY